MTLTASYMAAGPAAASALSTSAAVGGTARDGGGGGGGGFEDWARRGGGVHVSSFFLPSVTKTRRWGDGTRNGGGLGERFGCGSSENIVFPSADPASAALELDQSTLGTCQLASTIRRELRSRSRSRSRSRKESRQSRQLASSACSHGFFAEDQQLTRGHLDHHWSRVKALGTDSGGGGGGSAAATSTASPLSSSIGDHAAESPLTVDRGDLHRPLDHVFEAQQFDRELLMKLFELTRQMEKITPNSPGSRMLEGFIMATLFYEPSTRTRLSFESAMKRLGGNVLTTENAREFSSAAKGETLEDTIRTVETYSDIIVLRHFESGAAKRAASVSSVPLINAGDGPGQHPTQALLDVYTIQREIGHLDNIKVGLVGDLANGRTVRSLAYLLSKFNNVQLYFIAPEVARMKEDIKDHLTESRVQWEETGDLMEVASRVDVIYQTRIQRERFADRVDEYDQARGKYIVDKKIMEVLPEHAIVMHPLPRLDEITEEVDTDPRAAYFRQARNGLHIRMALLKLLLLGW